MGCAGPPWQRDSRDLRSLSECAFSFRGGELGRSDRRRSNLHRRSEEHTSELQSHSDLHSFPTRRSSDLWPSNSITFERLADPRSRTRAFPFLKMNGVRRAPVAARFP